MKGDPADPADWQKVALIDLARARKSTGEGDLSAATLWLEQCAEKAVKGWLIGQGWALVKTHDLERLCNEVGQRGVDLSWDEGEAPFWRSGFQPDSAGRLPACTALTER